MAAAWIEATAHIFCNTQPNAAMMAHASNLQATLVFAPMQSCREVQGRAFTGGLQSTSSACGKYVRVVFAAQRQCVPDVAHELRTPLTAVMLHVHRFVHANQSPI